MKKLSAILVLALLMTLAFVPAAFADGTTYYVSTAGNDSNGGLSADDALLTIQAAIDKAGAGDTVNIATGTYVLASTVNVNKAGLTVAGAGATTLVQASIATGTYAFNISAAGATLRNIQLQKTDKAGVQNLIYIGASNVTVRDNTIWGQFVIGDGDVSRAMEITGGLSGLLIQGNTIYNLRQPAYINNSTGLISSNYVYGTKGWVLETGAMTFTGNTWGTGAQANYLDIAILSTMPAGNYTDLPALSAANNDAVIEDQRTTPATLSDVFVDDDAPAGGDGTLTKPYQGLADAFSRVVPGGTVHVAAGTYARTSTLSIPGAKPNIKIVGAGRSSTVLDFSAVASNGLDVTANGVTLQALTIVGPAADTSTRYGVNVSGVSGLTVTDVLVRNSGRTGLNLNGATNATINNVELRDNLGCGIGLCDVRNVALSNVTTSGNRWGAVGIFTYGRYHPIGVDGVVFSGSNSFAEATNSVYLEEGNYATPGSPYPITWTTDPAGTANVKFQLSDFKAVLGYTSTATEQYKRFYASVAAAQAAAIASPLPDHMTADTGYVKSLEDGQYYVGNGMAIQPAINAAAAGNTVNAAAGTFVEQLEIAKDVTLQGAGAGTIVRSPDTLAIAFGVNGGTPAKKGIVYIHDTAAAVVKNLVVDGAGKGNANYQFCGVALHNASGTLQNLEVKDVRDTPFSGAQHGVGIYAYNDNGAPAHTVNVTNCNVHDFNKNAMALNGAGLIAHVSGCTVTGYGATTTTAQNGIQLGYGAAGSVSNCTVSSISYTPTSWPGCGILTCGGTSPVQVDVTNNALTSCEIAIYTSDTYGTISGNTVNSNLAGIGADDYVGIMASDPTFRLPSPVDADLAPKASRGQARASAAYAVTVSNNTLSGGNDSANSGGIAAFAGWGATVMQVNLTANSNTVHGWGVGMQIAQCTTGCNGSTFASAVAHQNNLAGNTWGMVADTPVNATDNWWGSANGPAHASNGYRPSQQGVPVSDNVTFAPWLNAAPPAGTSFAPVYIGSTPYPGLQAAIDAANPGDTIVIAAGTHRGGIHITKGVTIKTVPGGKIGPGSPAFTVEANDVTIDGWIIDGAGDTSGASGIVVNGGVANLWVRNCEILNWPADGIHLNGAVNGLKIVDNYVHINGSDGIEFAGAAPTGVVQIYGNSFRSNTGLGINAATATVPAEYNEWGDIAGPSGANGDGASTTVDADPWTFGKVYADVVPAPAVVRELETFTVDIKLDPATILGAQFSLSYGPALLEFVSYTASGAGYFQGADLAAVDTSTAGMVTFNCARRGSEGPISTAGIKLLTVTFKAKEITGASVTADIHVVPASVKLGAPNGVHVRVDSTASDSITILGTTAVSGVVDLQGRDNDSGAIVAVAAGASHGWDPSDYTTMAWGAYSFTDMTDDSYAVTVSRPLYLTAQATVTVVGDTLVLNKVVLLGGNANNDDKIDVSDLSIIGGEFGHVGGGIGNPNADINGDGQVDILDLVLAAGNYDLTASPWTPQ